MSDLQTEGLVFNGLNLDMTSPDATFGYRLQASADGLEWGDVQAVLLSIQSQLMDGSVESVSRFENREVSFLVRVDAPGADLPGAAIAQGQAALESACRFDGWAALSFTPMLDGAETSVREITAAWVDAPFDLRGEIDYTERVVKLTLRARPFVRPTTTDTFDAPTTVGSTTTSVDSGSSTTGWSLLSTAPGVMTNRMPNPSFESNTTGWSAGTGVSSITRNTGAGTYFSKNDGTSGLYVAGSQTMFLNGPLMSGIVAGTTYTVLLAIYKEGQTGPGGCLVRYYSDAGGTLQIGSDATTPFTMPDGNGPDVWRSFNTTAPSGAITMRIYPKSTSYDFVLDAAEVIDAPSAPPFTGASTNTTALTYAWTGTANNSTSTATWSSPVLAVTSGMVRGTVYGRSSASIRRGASVTMSSLNYMRIQGLASIYSDGLVTVSDNGVAVSPISYNYNQTTGAFDILIKRPGGFTTVDVAFSRTSGTIDTVGGLFVAVDQIDITDNPFAGGKVQTRQVTIYGSQRTELSLSILGLDSAGTSAVTLGEQVLIHTAAAGTDARSKFLGCRAAAAVTGTSDSTATSGAYNTLNTTGTPTNFTFAASTLLPGNYLLVARVMPTTTGAKVLSFRGYADPSTGDNVYDPPGGSTWKTCPLAVGTSGWPAIAQNAWGMLPLGLLRLPPADLRDSGATLTVQIAADTNSVVRVDDVFLLNADVGQTSLIRTDIAGSSFSAVQLNAATIDSPTPTVWVGVANSTMMTDPTRLLGFEQHQSAPGLLQVSSVTPNCATSRLAGSYYRRYGNDVAPAGS